MLAIIIGVIMTIRKLKSQLVQVDTALALPRVLMGFTSAGYSQGRGSHVAPKNAMYVNKPTAAPFAGPGLPGMRAPKTRTIDRPGVR